MSLTWVTGLTFVATVLLLAAAGALANDLFFRYHVLLGNRLDELNGTSKRDPSESLFRDLKQLAALASTDRSRRTRYREAIEQSGLHLSLFRLTTIAICLGAVLAAGSAMVSHRWWMALVGLVPGLLAPAVYITVKRQARQRRLIMQLPEVFDTMRRVIRAGQTVPAAFQIVADTFDAPISEEFQCCYEQQHLGMPYDAALRNLARRTGIMELRILVVALLVQSRSGGNLVELLDNLSGIIRKRIKFQQRVKALTGEGRMQAAILIVLPALAFAVLLVLSPDYAGTLLQRPWLLAAAATGQLIGAFWIRRIINFAF